MTFLTDIAAAQVAALHVYGVMQIGDVVGEPISLEDARKQCRVDTFEEGSPPESVSDDDAWLTDIGIPGARQYCENELGVALCTRTMELATNAFPSGPINLPFGPVQSITSVTYLDSDGAEQILSAAGYEIDPYTVPARLMLTYGSTWPVARDFANSVKVRYVAGYNLNGDSPNPYPLPPIIRSAMLVMLEFLYDNRDGSADIPPAVRSLLFLAPNRERLGFA